jgi:hypothetical protein
MITIDTRDYDIPVISVTRTADFLDKYAERTEDGELHRELIGVYFNYKIKFGETKNYAEYALLWQILSSAVEFHDVIVPDENGACIYEFQAYFAGVGDELRLMESSINYWHNLTANFIAKVPAITPTP